MSNTKSTSVFYVYRHTFSNGSIYIGKGLGNRSHEFGRGRSLNYSNLLKEFGKPLVEILASELSEEDAYKLERTEIINSRARNNNVINITDGYETSDIGSMPPRTLLHSMMHRKIHPQYRQIVHLKSISNAGRYSIGITIASAAIKLNLTCNALIEVLNKEELPTIGDFQFISQEEAIKIAPAYKNRIIEATEKAKHELEAEKNLDK
jgi:hypothetical protein